MRNEFEAMRDFVGPWWLTVALIEMQSREVVEPPLRALTAATAAVAVGPVVRLATEAHMPLRWHSWRGAALLGITGRLCVTEIDAERTALTLTAATPPGLVTPAAFDAVAGDLALAIEAAVAREIGTPATRDATNQ